MTDQVLKLHFKLCGDCCGPRRGPCTVPSWLRAPLPEPGCCRLSHAKSPGALAGPVDHSLQTCPHSWKSISV